MRFERYLCIRPTWSAYLLLGMALSFLYQGCEPDPCLGVTCENGGVCVSGNCECPTGFTGLRCELAIDPCQLKACPLPGSQGCVVSPSGVAVCQCREGYQGEFCDQKWTDPYAGLYNCLETCDGTEAPFSMSVEEGPQFMSLTFNNFHNQTGAGSSSRMVAYLLTSKAFEFKEQFMPYGRVDGLGTRDQDGTIRLAYTIIQGGDTLNCTAVLTTN